MRKRIAFVIACTLLVVAAAFLLPAVPQPLEYHHFADQRSALGIHNVLDVVSNLAFLIAGIVGLAGILSGRARFEFPSERWPWAFFFLGILLTAAGSSCYHLDPNNETLFWDRLPMTIAFMGLVSSQIVDRISVRAGLVLLGPLLLVGVASVVYWIATEHAGAGNVLPYALLQGYAMLVLLLMAVLTPSRYTRASDLYFIFGWYAAAKLLESFDAQVLAYSHVVSGHTLKHVAAAGAGFVAASMLMRRTLRVPVSQGR
ncbi:MAG: alkaline phytoceramidase [Burkholderiales bacterium]|nr:alkaline phytoceramidase [Burkholderiales bacterium]